MMRHMTRRDLAVVAATSICLAVIGIGIYISRNYTIVKANGIPDSNTVVAKQESPTPLQSNRKPVKRYRSAEKPKKFSDHAEVLKSQQEEQPLVAAASPVVTSAPVSPKVVLESQATKPAGEVRREPSTETWQPSPRSEVWSGTARSTPSTSYEQPQGETRQRRGMTRNEKIVVGSAIGGGILTAILIAKRHR
jgi:hypothetical protein